MSLILSLVGFSLTSMMNTDLKGAYHAEGVDNLLVALEEATRATPDGGRRSLFPRREAS